MWLLLLGVLILYAIWRVLVYLQEVVIGASIPSWRTMRLFRKLPGPTDLPFYLGGAKALLDMEFDDILLYLDRMLKKYNGMLSWYEFGQPTVILSKAEYIELILKSTVSIEKGTGYKLMKDWINEGLLTSGGNKWRQRRKLLTPSFHFKILETSEECMNQNFKKVAEKMLEAGGKPVQPLQYLRQGTLNIICESAMGSKLEELGGGETYVQNVNKLPEVIMKRAFSLLYRIEWIFKRTELGKSYYQALKSIHDFTENVIQRKRGDHAVRKGDYEYSDNDGKKLRAFLDCIVEEAEKTNMTIQDIREEVDTFMFAGHDTTSTALQYILFHLGHHPDIQEKAYQEQVEIFGDSLRDVTKEDMHKMTYLDQIIKESMRLNPPAPAVERMLSEDILMPNGALVPAGTRILICFYLLHRDPAYFPDPESFNPDRFNLQESKNRNPFAYLPFSAGARNCIGQKFAMMEMKIGLSTILRHSRIKSITKNDELKYKMVIILEPNKPIELQVLPRN